MNRIVRLLRPTGHRSPLALAAALAVVIVCAPSAPARASEREISLAIYTGSALVGVGGLVATGFNVYGIATGQRPGLTPLIAGGAIGGITAVAGGLFTYWGAASKAEGDWRNVGVPGVMVLTTGLAELTLAIIAATRSAKPKPRAVSLTPILGTGARGQPFAGVGLRVVAF